MAWLILASGQLAGQSEQFTEYEYDEIGRVQAIETAVEQSAPVITAILPAVVRRGPPVSVAVTGSGLRGALPSTSPGIAITTVTATEGRVSLQLQADESVPLGEHRLSFTTPLGSAEIAFTVRPRLPVLRVVPNPLALAPGESRELVLSTDRDDVIDHTFTLSTSPADVATVTPNATQLLTGSTDAGRVTVAAAALGNALLRIDSEEIRSLSLPVFVTAPYQWGSGSQFYSNLLGVQVGEPAGPPRLIPRGPFVARLGVVMPAPSSPAVLLLGPVASPPLGVSLGRYARELRPSRVVRGTGVTTVELHGVGLDALSTLTLDPAAGVNLAVQSIDPDGRRAQLSVDAEPGTVLGPRRLQLTATDGGEIAFSQPSAGLLHIVEPLPELEWVAPQLLVRGTANLILRMRGVRLGGATAVRLMPSDGITVGGTPMVSADGTELSVALAVAANASLGTRLVSVVTAAGESTDQAEPANTVQVVAGLGRPVTPVVSPLLGVRLGDDEAAGVTQTHLLASTVLGVSRGAMFSALRPSAGAVGESLTLQIEGNQLQAVDRVSIEPAEGLNLGTPQVSVDGRGVSLPLSIDSHAARSLRRLRLWAGSVEIPPSEPSLGGFRVTLPLPVIESVDPLLLVPGAAPVGVTIRGRNLLDVNALRTEPAESVVFSAPTVAADGLSLTASVAVAAGAALGPRILILESPTGSSTEIADSANTITLVQGLGTPVRALSAPPLGVQVGSDTAATVPLQLSSALLGVEIARTPPALSQSLLLSAPATSVVIGSSATAVTPRYLPRGSSATLRIEGIALDGTDAIALQPADGITVGSPIVVAADGRAVNVPITIAADAPETARRVVVQRGSVELPFAMPGTSVVRVVGNEPRIDSISPIQVTPGQTFALTIRGVNLFGVSAVTATPSTGLAIGANPQGNADGTEVTVAVTVSANAPGGPRVIRVISSNGTTGDEAVPANTLTVVTGQ